jgi:hypothetical protein
MSRMVVYWGRGFWRIAMDSRLCARGLDEFLLPAWATEIRPTRDIREDPRPMALLCNVAAGSITNEVVSNGGGEPNLDPDIAYEIFEKRRNIQHRSKVRSRLMSHMQPRSMIWQPRPAEMPDMSQRSKPGGSSSPSRRCNMKGKISQENDCDCED